MLDEDDDGNVSISEIIKLMSRLTRGKLEDITRVFFEMFDVNNDDKLVADEVIEVYKELMQAIDEDLTVEQMQRIKDFINKSDLNEDGHLTYIEFLAAVKGIQKEQKAAKPKTGWKGWLWIGLLVFLTAWFEVGTSFALPAMGALSARVKQRFDITDKEIGTLTGAYYISAMIGPLIGGYSMMKFGPGLVIISANIVVMLGAALQAFQGPFWLLLIARMLIGLGGEITPFTTIEILNRLFPGSFLLMCGIRNLIQSASGFLAFLLLPMVADHFDTFPPTPQATIEAPTVPTAPTTPEPIAPLGPMAPTAPMTNTTAEPILVYDETGATAALWFIVALGGVSLATNVIVFFIMRKQRASEAQNISKSPAAFFRNLSKAIAPSSPSKWSQWMLPFSFYMAIFGIKSFYFAPFSFTAFSVKVFEDRYNLSSSIASFLSGFMSLIAGLLGPIFGPISDRYGRRSISLAAFMVPSLIGFILFSLPLTGTWVPWVGVTLMALSYGFGDTVAYVTIRLLVGEKRAGIGYGIYGIFGNFLSFLVPFVGGFIIIRDNGLTYINFYFTALMILGTLSWVGVRLLSGSKAAVELSADDLAKTTDDDLNAALMFGVVHDATVNEANVELEV